jgi:hypothetical protein
MDICKTIIDLIPAYSIGATTPEETARVEALLPDCPQAIDLLTDYLMLADDLALAVQPPKTAQTNGEIHLNGALVRGKARPVTSPVVQPHSTPHRGWVGLAVAALLLILLGVTNIYWYTANQRLENTQVIAQPVEALPVLAGDFAHRDLSATEDGQPESRASVIWNPETSIGSIYVTGLPPLDDQHNYYVWLVREETAVTLGQFSVDPNGNGILLFQSEEPLESYDAIGVNVEPIGGSQTPTTPHVVIGEI